VNIVETASSRVKHQNAESFLKVHPTIGLFVSDFSGGSLILWEQQHNQLETGTRVKVIVFKIRMQTAFWSLVVDIARNNTMW